MLEALAKYTPITKVLVTGGLSQKSQEMSFRQQPDIVVATPGRVLDLLLNSPSVHLELLEIVVLDEADRLLEMGFKEEVVNRMTFYYNIKDGECLTIFSVVISIFLLRIHFMISLSAVSPYIETQFKVETNSSLLGNAL